MIKLKFENGLTAKRQKFCDNILDHPDWSQSKCYREAGFAGNSETCSVESSKLLKNPSVSAYLEQRRKEIEDRTTVNVEYIIENAKSVLEKSLQQVPVMEYDYEEQRKIPTGEYVFDSKGANGALKILGDVIGAFNHTKKMELGIPENNPLTDIMLQLKNHSSIDKSDESETKKDE